MKADVNFVKMNEAIQPSNELLTESTEFVVFQLGKWEYGIDIRQIQRLRSYQSLTRIANGADFVEGVAISDGVIMPIIDLRLSVNIATPTFNHFTVVIILNILGRTSGLVVDSATDIITLTTDQVEPVPEMGSALDTNYLIGLGVLDERKLILVDIDRLMSNSEMELIKNFAIYY